MREELQWNQYRLEPSPANLDSIDLKYREPAPTDSQLAPP